MKILVTGSSGFVGGALVPVLRSLDHEVTEFDTRGPPLAVPDTTKGWGYRRRDVLDVTALRAAMEKQEVVFHLAAVNGTENFYKRPFEVLEVGAAGALNVARVAKDAGVRRLIVASSSEVYQSVEGPAGEAVPFSVPDPSNPRYSYAISKMVTEYAANWSGVPEVVVVRPHNIYGPGAGTKHVVPQLITKARASTDGTLEVAGDADQTRAFCYIDDCVVALALMMTVPPGTYNVGTTEEIAISELAEKIFKAVTGKAPTLKYGTGAPGGPPRRCPDITKLTSLGWKPEVGLDEGLEKTVKWYLTQ